MFLPKALLPLFFLCSLWLSGCPEDTISRFQGPQLLANSPLHFGESPVGVRQRGHLVITNGGDAPLTINDFKITPEDGVFLAGISELPLTIGGRRSKDLILNFRPRSEISYQAELTFDSNHDGDTLDPIILLGTGISNILCLPCEPPPDPECSLDGLTSIYYFATTSTNCESASGFCAYEVIEIPCEGEICDEETGLCPNGVIPTFDAGPAQEPTPDAGPAPEPTPDAGPAPEPTPDAGPAPEPTPDAGPAPEPTPDAGPTQPVCGNSTLEDGEECDDGDVLPDDGCSAICTIEDGWNCAVAPCVEICGDGITVGTEECDDAGESATCDTDCTAASCGDGTINAIAGEDCDDAGESATCDIDCTTAACGDNQINTTAGEECDDGENVPGDSCSATCTIEDGWNCAVEPCVEICGDGIRVGNEECDDAGESDICDIDCSFASCGDGTLNNSAGELCDDAGESETCDSDCSLSSCGDGLINTAAGEDCDDAGESATCDTDCTDAACGDGTTNTTANEDCDDAGESATCNDDCSSASCGDGILNTTANEECDDAGESATCNANCTEAGCGDSIVNASAGEVCDDGDALDNGGGCSATCTAVNGWDCTTGPCVEVCGDGQVVGAEECDDLGPYTFAESLICDYNTTCQFCHSTSCTIENGTDSGSCGDGDINGDEQCDNAADPQCINCDCPTNGSLNYSLNSSNLCEYCGDGIIIEGELCDTGIDNHCESCLSCQNDSSGTPYPMNGTICGFCGDETTSGNEECDNGNNDGSYGTCKTDCTFAPKCGDQTIDTAYNETCDDDETYTFAESLICDYNTTCQFCHSTTCTIEDGTDSGSCGDGEINGSEECDDAADPQCINCDCPINGSLNYSLNNDDLCNYCGDGSIDDGELCDTGIDNHCESCLSCQNDSSGTPYPMNGTICGFCGDEATSGNEECDNGINDGSYGTCKTDCTFAPKCGDQTIDTAYNETCDGTAQGIAGCRDDCSYCGDNVTNSTHGEDCDDGNDSEDDSCTNDCKNIICGDDDITGNENCEMTESIGNSVPFVSDYQCPYQNDGPNQCIYCDSDTCKSTAASGPYCGDGAEQTEEECDSNTADSFWGTSLICDYGEENCSYCNSDTCLIASGAFAGICGNDIIESGSDGSDNDFDEECDNTADSNCSLCACPTTPLDYTRNTNTDLCYFCGDGLVSDDEKCDTDGDSNCSYCTTCGNDPDGAEYPMNGDLCAFCGDDETQGNEICDNASDIMCVFCSCPTSPHVYSLNTSNNLNHCHFCGDGIVSDGESCDLHVDNNDGTYNGCNANCSFPSRCGDNLLDAAEGETCDGTYGGIDCYDNCNYCGDGIPNLDDGEECDDGNDDETDGCFSDCTTLKGDYCGDGLLDQVATLSGNGYIQLPWEQGMDWSPPFTVEGWLYATSDGGPIWGGGYVSNGFVLSSDSGSNIEIKKCVSSTCQTKTSQNVSSMQNRWTYFALTAARDSLADPTTVVLHLDDTVSEEHQNSVFDENFSYDNADDLGLGQSFCCSSGTWQGGMDDIRFWSRALTQEEITSSRLGTLSLESANGLMASFRMNIDGSTLINDTGDTSRNGLLQGSAQAGPSDIAETCDDGNNTTETECPYGPEDGCDVCNSDCTVETTFSARFCGDGVEETDEGETCDDGNQTTETECSYGTAECLLCNDLCTEELALTGPYCSNGIVDGAEECDDQNLDGGDGCNSICQEEDGWDCSIPPCSFTFVPPEAAETCTSAPELFYAINHHPDTTYVVSGNTDYGYTDNEDGYPCSDLSYGTDNWPTQDGEEVFYKIQLGYKQWFNMDVDSGDDVDISIYAFQDCNSPVFVDCTNEHGRTYSASGLNNDEAFQLGNYQNKFGLTTYYIALDAWCDNDGSTSVHCPRNADRSLSFSYYIWQFDYCGDGKIGDGEECDDANGVDTDGCENDCEVSPGYLCVDEPSVCTD